MALQKEFLDGAETAVIYGLSRSGAGFGWEVLSALRAHSPITSAFAVHPAAAASEMKGLPVFRSASAISPAPALAIIVLKPKDAYNALEDVARSEIRRVWLAMGSCSKDNREYAEKQGLEVVGGCPILFLEVPSFPHNLHRALAKICGKI